MYYQVDIKVDDDEIINYINDGFYPEDVFDESKLHTWALENGYKLEED